MRKIHKTRIGVDDREATLLPPIRGAETTDDLSEGGNLNQKSAMSSYAPLTERRPDVTRGTASELSVAPMRPTGVEQAPKHGLGGVAPAKPHERLNIVEEAKTAENFNADTIENSQRDEAGVTHGQMLPEIAEPRTQGQSKASTRGDNNSPSKSYNMQNIKPVA